MRDEPMDPIAVDIIEAGGFYRVEVALPGVLEADIQLTFEESRLLIFAERPPASGVYLAREIPRGVLSREVFLPEALDLVGLELDEGVLRLTLRRKGGS